jgi:hypothetical protein
VSFFFIACRLLKPDGGRCFRSLRSDVRRQRIDRCSADKCFDVLYGDTIDPLDRFHAVECGVRRADNLGPQEQTAEAQELFDFLCSKGIPCRHSGSCEGLTYSLDNLLADDSCGARRRITLSSPSTSSPAPPIMP